MFFALRVAVNDKKWNDWRPQENGPKEPSTKFVEGSFIRD